MSYAFEEKVLSSPIPVVPEAGSDFQTFFGYHFAQSLNEYNWGPEATPSHMVTTYPVALQRAWEQVNNMDSTWTWWNSVYDTMPMADIYAELLHKTVDLACQQNEWSHKNQVALHKYADAFIQEAQNPQFNIMNQMARQLVMGYMRFNGNEHAQAFATMLADMMRQQLPNNLTFNEAYCVDGWMSCVVEEFAEELDETQEKFGEKYSLEATICRLVSEASTSERFSPSSIDGSSMRFEQWAEQMLEVVHNAIQLGGIQLTELTPFREGTPGLTAFVGYAIDDYLQAHPELQTQFDQESACEMDAHSPFDYSEEYTHEMIIRGFCKPTPLVEESFEIIEDVMRTLNLTERQFFLHQFEFTYGNNPANMAGAVQIAFEMVEDRFGKIPDTEDVLQDCVEVAQEHDIAFQEQYANQDVTYGGYQFTQQYAEYYAQGLQDVFNGLPVKMRAEFAKAFDDAMSAGDEIKAAKAAFLTLPEDAQTALKADFERAYDSLEYDAMDRDWDD
jgi:hypothetical protein